MSALRAVGALLLFVTLTGCDNGSTPGKGNSDATAGTAPTGGSVNNAGGSSTASDAGAAGSSASGGSATAGGSSGSSGSSGSGGAGDPPFSTDNLIVNGDAEQGDAGWMVAGSSTAIRAVKYGENGYPTAAEPGPAQRGLSFFDGGDSARADSHQSVDVSAHAARIERGLRARLDAFLGGYQAQNDTASVVLRFVAADGSLLSQSVLGGPDAAERLSTTSLLAYQLDTQLPPLTHTIDVHLVMVRTGGTGSDGYADNLRLVLHN
ncbi:MAG TPA: hypothetical protein VHB79_23220 [Polyangiaceae bacterium]|nr:hypothetical protein [Polyangiaceae bacterium]